MGKQNTRKNPVELDGLKNAHTRDGAAVVQYLVWLDKQMQEIYGASGYFMEAESTSKKNHLETTKLTEVTASDKLEGFRASKEHFRGLSFPTISSVGPNAAIIHYQPDAKTCSELDADSIYLFDSGAQGSMLHVHVHTALLTLPGIGHCFSPVPASSVNGTYSRFSRVILHWVTLAFQMEQMGMHWTFLLEFLYGRMGLIIDMVPAMGLGLTEMSMKVSEEEVRPHLISFRPHARNVPLQASMTVTDEPGYYEDGNFGIRLENVLIVREADTKFNFGDKGFLSFEHITWALYQKKLIDLSLLTPEEIDWVNTYHSNCREILASYLDDTETAWLKKATEPISA
ncbi:hypothetical protein RHMOL_Rhmol07G0232000 [Rhododendron molle]|uniref:Uncharacterized protein n=1 Tax=Rhododendron molle TaxID=49168 RepID=A0ACC0N3R9_RHOML|nr:hypothetical protein RHMOL_Rhmol07G0232000 [Rhododendron molle]